MREEILTISDKEISIEFTGNALNSIKNKNITKKGVRIFKSGKIYSASFVGSIDNSTLLKMASKNKDGATYFNYDLPELISLSQKDILNSKGENDLFINFRETINWLKQNYPNFIFSGKAKLNRFKKKLEIVEKSKIEHEFDICSWGLTYKHRKSTGIVDGYFGGNSVYDFDIDLATKKYSHFLDVFENKVKLNPGKIPVVFAQSDHLFKKIIESARVDFYKKGIGLFKGKLENTVLNEKFSLMDISYKPVLLAMDLFDAEGFVRKNAELDIIKDGVFKNLICDSRNAAKYKLKSTGNSKRLFDTASRLGFNNLRVKEGKRTVKEILNDLPKCIIVEISIGGTCTDTGNYSTPVQNGFFVQDGKIKGKIPQITLTSSVEEMFGNKLIEIASDSISPLEYNPAIFTEMHLFLN